MNCDHPENSYQKFMSQRSRTCRTDVDRNTLGALLLPDAGVLVAERPAQGGNRHGSRIDRRTRAMSPNSESIISRSRISAV